MAMSTGIFVLCKICGKLVNEGSASLQGREWSSNLPSRVEGVLYNVRLSVWAILNLPESRSKAR